MFKVGDKARRTQSTDSSYIYDKIYTYEINKYSKEYPNDFTCTDEKGDPNGMGHGSFVLVEEKSELKTGLRYNQNKLRWRNVPMFLLKPLIEVGAYGESKYETYNFLKGLPISDTLDSLKRHLEQFESPYEADVDNESQVNHLAHVAWNALIALHVYNTRKDLDDRYKLPEQVQLSPEEIQRRGR